MNRFWFIFLLPLTAFSAVNVGNRLEWLQDVRMGSNVFGHRLMFDGTNWISFPEKQQTMISVVATSNLWTYRPAYKTNVHRIYTMGYDIVIDPFDNPCDDNAVQYWPSTHGLGPHNTTLFLLGISTVNIYWTNTTGINQIILTESTNINSLSDSYAIVKLSEYNFDVDDVVIVDWKNLSVATVYPGPVIPNHIAAESGEDILGEQNEMIYAEN